MAPVSVSRPMRPQALPSVRSNGVYTRIGHAETFASVVTTGTDFEVASYAVNPGVASCFPWLSQVAARFETYKFRTLKFKYYSQVSSASAGIVALCFDFDAQDPAPVTLFQGLSYRDRASDSVWRPCDLRLDLLQGDKSPSKYTRVGLPASPFDLKTFDIGALHVCSEGAAAATIGRIEVEYVVDLFTPQIQDPVGGLVTLSTGMDATHLLGTASVVDAQAIMPFTVNAAGNTVTFNQSWEGEISVHYTGTGLNDNINPNALGPSGTAATQLIHIVDTTTTHASATWRVRAFPSTTLTPTMTATTLTAGFWCVGTCAYASLA